VGETREAVDEEERIVDDGGGGLTCGGWCTCPLENPLGRGGGKAADTSKECVGRVGGEELTGLSSKPLAAVFEKVAGEAFLTGGRGESGGGTHSFSPSKSSS
jgi:hypothetical protein